MNDFVTVEREPGKAYNVFEDGVYRVFDRNGELVDTVDSPKDAVELTNWLNDPENVVWWRIVCYLSWCLP
jgi:hypothetical protein